MNDHGDAYGDLLGAYALDAVEADERELIEVHLAQCPRCRAEVAEHREVAACLSQAGAPAPEGVWDRIAAELSPPAPPMRMSFSMDGDVDPLANPPGPGGQEADEQGGHGAEVVALGSRPTRRRRRARTMVAAVAAAVLVAGLAAVSVNQTRRVDRLEQAYEDVSIDRLANGAVGSSEVQVHLRGRRGDAQAVVQDSGRGFLLTEGISGPPPGDVYQLWGQIDGVVLSLGTFGPGASVVPFQIDPSHLGDVQSFAVTQEKAPGVVASQQPPVVAGTI